MALRHLSNETIDNFDTDQTTQAQACREFYEQAKFDLLTEFSWFFAQKQANLARLTTTPLFTWNYEYQLPNDLLRIERVLASTERPAVNPPYEVMGDKILTNEQQVRHGNPHGPPACQQYPCAEAPDTKRRCDRQSYTAIRSTEAHGNRRHSGQ
jgi:hypothetical protein